MEENLATITAHSASELAHAVNKDLRLNLTARPWNHYSPQDTFWWLVPSPEWPAYRYGKLAFSSLDEAPRKDLLGLDDAVLEGNKLFAGFNVEKGFGPAAVFVDPTLRRRPQQLVDPNWLWFEMMTSGAERFERTLQAISRKAEACVYVVATYVHDRESDFRHQRDALMFRYGPKGFTLLLDRLQVHVLDDARRCTTFQDLAGKLAKLDDYHWVDFYVGSHVPTGSVDLRILHDQVLSHFQPWLR